jgi:uncharacterized protein YkwD
VKRAALIIFALATGTVLIGTAMRGSPSTPEVSPVSPTDDLARLRGLALSAPRIQRPRAASRSVRAPLTRHHVSVSTHSAPAISSRSSAAAQIASMIEQARSQHGLRSLASNGTLVSSARSHSASMARDNQIYHSSRSELWGDAQRACSSCSDAGEIVGMGTSARQIFDAFMSSSTHRDVILNGSFRYFGMGVVYSRGAYWVTVQFAG